MEKELVFSVGKFQVWSGRSKPRYKKSSSEKSRGKNCWNQSTGHRRFFCAGNWHI